MNGNRNDDRRFETVHNPGQRKYTFLWDLHDLLPALQVAQAKANVDGVASDAVKPTLKHRPCNRDKVTPWDRVSRQSERLSGVIWNARSMMTVLKPTFVIFMSLRGLRDVSHLLTRDSSFVKEQP